MNYYSIKAPAKINLFLHIVGKKDRGYHLIETIFAFTSLSNFLSIKVGTHNHDHIVEFVNPKSRIHRKYNTVIKAIRSLVRYAPKFTKVSVRIIKNIPTGAGLGSGSSDAGAVIHMLGRLWNVDKPILNEIALKIGTDVPASMYSKPAFAKGVGEDLFLIKKFNFPKYIVLVKPRNSSLNTSDVFDKYNGQFSTPLKWDEGEDLIEFVKNMKNDLQEVAIELVPEIGNIILELEKQKGCILARMSGSGTTCFGVFDSEEYAKLVARNLKEQQPKWWVCHTQLIV